MSDFIPSNEIRDFWRSVPTPLWQEKADDTIRAFQDGAQVVMLSGMCGMGKTLQYGIELQNRLGDQGVAFTPEGEPSIETFTEPGKIAVVDEVTIFGLNEQVTDHLVRVLSRPGQQSVLIFAGTERAKRLQSKANITAALNAVSSPVVDLGDFSRTTVDADKTTALLKKLEITDDGIELFRDNEVLRSPRFMDYLLSAVKIRLFNDQRTNAQAVLDDINASIVDAFLELNSPTWQFSIKLMNSLGDNTNIHRPLISANCLSTEEVAEVYGLVNQSLPSVSDLAKTYRQPWFFDPFNKG